MAAHDSSGGHFARLLEVLRPSGGLMFIVEGYFDESGDLDAAPKIFCVAGYFVAPNAARAMDIEWRKVLSDHGNLPYFRSVECMHEPPRGPFAGKPKDERVEIVKKLIQIIKDHALEGISVIARAATYQGSIKGEPSLYSHCASACARALQQFIYSHRIEGGIAYYFESGHTQEGSAFTHLAEKVKRPQDTLTFAGKTEVPLLAAGDLLAWQSTKYAKDYFYPKIVDGGAPIRPPRKDFQSLMLHPHVFFHLDSIGDGSERSMGVETWPMHLRNPNPGLIKSTIDDSGPIIFLREDGDPNPIIPVEKTLGWRLGGGRLAYVTFEGVAKKSFTLALDEPRLLEAVSILLAAAGIYAANASGGILVGSQGATIENFRGERLLCVTLYNGISLRFHLSADALERLKAEIERAKEQPS